MQINFSPDNYMIDIPDQCFKVKYNAELVHQVITSYLSNSRSNSSSQKNRSQVRGGGKKPWRQKGTGRARAGTSSSPLWRGGGVTFATGKSNYEKKINKKMRKLAMRTIISEMFRKKRVVVIEKIDIKEVKTKNIKKILDDLKLKSVLIIIKDLDQKIVLSARNIKDVGIATVDYIDPVSLLDFENILFTKESLEDFGEKFGETS